MGEGEGTAERGGGRERERIQGWLRSEGVVKKRGRTEWARDGGWGGGQQRPNNRGRGGEKEMWREEGS